MPGSGTPLVPVWLGRVLWLFSTTGRPGQRLCTTAHALSPHMEAAAGTLQVTDVSAATLANAAITLILFISAPSNDLFLEHS